MAGPHPEIASHSPREGMYAVRLHGGPDVMIFSSPVPVAAGDGRLTACFTLAAGESVCFGLQHRRTEGRHKIRGLGIAPGLPLLL